MHWGRGSSTEAISIGQAGHEGVKNEIQASQIAGRCGGVFHLLIAPKVTVHAIKYMYRSWILPLQGP